MTNAYCIRILSVDDCADQFAAPVNESSFARIVTISFR